jgi:hypothetical protein
MGAIKRFAEATGVAMGLGEAVDTVIAGYCQHALNLEQKCIKEPLTVEQIHAQMNEGRIQGIVRIPVDDLIELNRSEVMERFCKELVGEAVDLWDIDSTLTGVDIARQWVYFVVSGRPV